MAAKNEHPEKYGWWLNELESLGVSPKVCNELNDMQEVSNLTEILKQTFYQQYLANFSIQWDMLMSRKTPRGIRGQIFK
jgi:hypothetical protein